jgi:hypothetical protein
MVTIEFLVGGRHGIDARTADGEALRDVERRLLGRMDGLPKCPESPRDLHVCLYGERPGALKVSVTDCCCDRHARLVRESAEAVLGA